MRLTNPMLRLMPMLHITPVSYTHLNVSLATTTAKICAKTKSGKFIALDKSLKVLEESVSQIPDTIFADGLEIEKYKIGKVLDENSSPDTCLLYTSI